MAGIDFPTITKLVLAKDPAGPLVCVIGYVTPRSGGWKIKRFDQDTSFDEITRQGTNPAEIAQWAESTDREALGFFLADNVLVQ